MQKIKKCFIIITPMWGKVVQNGFKYHGFGKNPHEADKTIKAYIL